MSQIQLVTRIDLNLAEASFVFLGLFLISNLVLV